MKLLKDKTRILLIGHYINRAEGSEETDQRTLNFILTRVKKVVYITHPFPNSIRQETIYEVYEDGKLQHKEAIPILKTLTTLQYFIHALLTIYLFIKSQCIFDLCICLEDLSFMTLFPFRLFGVVKRIVYYSVDFSPVRFRNPLLNNLYHFLDKFACTNSDLNWVMVEEQIKARENRDKDVKYSKFALAPIGYKRSLIDIKPTEKIDLYNLIFAGALLENSGPHLGIKALPYLVKKFPKIHYTIVGRGIFEAELKKITKQLELEKKVKFTGYVEKFSDLTEILSKGSIGLAPFVPNPDSLSFYSDPSKIKLYIVSGLPVITTGVTTIAGLIRQTKSGEVIEFSEKALANAIEKMIGSKHKYSEYKKAAVKLSEKFDIENILKEAFEKIPN